MVLRFQLFRNFSVFLAAFLVAFSTAAWAFSKLTPLFFLSGGVLVGVFAIFLNDDDDDDSFDVIALSASSSPLFISRAMVLSWQKVDFMASNPLLITSY